MLLLSRHRKGCFSFAGKSVHGFTLIELMIVISIIIILIGLGIREYIRMSEDAKITRARHDLKSIADAIANFNSAEKRSFYKVRSLKSLAGRYLEKIPRDPWGKDYRVDGTFVFCLGPDRKISGDDIKLKYERESIVRNPTFQTTYSLSDKASVPTGWTFNPKGLSLGESADSNYVDMYRPQEGDSGPPSGNSSALKIQ